MIKHPDSHVDHGLTEAQLHYLLTLFADRKGFFVETITLPSDLGTVPCGLYGPAMGDPAIPEDAVTYAHRGNRAWKSRLVDLPARQQHEVTVVAGPHDGHPCVLYTAFGGPGSPREPADIRRELEAVERQRYGLSDLSDDHKVLTAKIEKLRAQRAEADTFWREHALAR